MCFKQNKQEPVSSLFLYVVGKVDYDYKNTLICI